MSDVLGDHPEGLAGGRPAAEVDLATEAKLADLLTEYFETPAERNPSSGQNVATGMTLSRPPSPPPPSSRYRTRPVLVLLVALGLVVGTTAAAAALAPDLAALRAAVDADPENGSAWYALGLALQERGEHEPALAAFDRAIELRFQAGGALMRSAQILAATGDLEASLRRLEIAVERVPPALALLPAIGGIPELEGDPRLDRLLERAHAARYPCADRAASRQLDFWIGDWTVHNPRGDVVGESQVRADLGGCVIRESWTDGYGGRGTSVSFFHSATERWHQVWTADNGTVTHYVGGWRDGAMRFLSTDLGEHGDAVPPRRMTFTPQADGTVRQRIETSEDGATWTVGFDGRYRPQDRAAEEERTMLYTEVATMTNETRTAVGTFEVQMEPIPSDLGWTGLELGQMSLDKKFAGDWTPSRRPWWCGTSCRGSRTWASGRCARQRSTWRTRASSMPSSVSARSPSSSGTRRSGRPGRASPWRRSSASSGSPGTGVIIGRPTRARSSTSW